MQSQSSEIIAQYFRGPFVESQSRISAVVLDEQKNIVQSWGDIQSGFYPRSSIKMLQAIPFLESGAVDYFGLGDQHICLACASHSGEKAHAEKVLSWLEKMDLSDTNLECGVQAPFHKKSAEELLIKNKPALCAHNNCSGKHAGFLATAKMHQEKLTGYIEESHPVQKRVTQVLKECFQFELNSKNLGIDGCGIPTYYLPMIHVAYGMCEFLNDKSTYRSSLQRIQKAVLSEPYYLAGTNRADTDIIQVSQGNVLSKAGAEGVFAGVFLNQGMSFVLKVHDGNQEVSNAALCFLALRMKAITEEQFVQLTSHSRPVKKNWAGKEVGYLKCQDPSQLT